MTTTNIDAIAKQTVAIFTAIEKDKGFAKQTRDANKRRVEQLRPLLQQVWDALEAGQPVQRCTAKEEWAKRFANTTMRNIQYILAGGKGIAGAMNLYHGTLASLVPLIMREGLKPRGERPSHDAFMDSASMPLFVYLTANYGTAINHAYRISERTADGTPIAVLELDMTALKRKLIYPDEDYLIHEWNSDFVGWSLKEQLEFMEYHRDTWRESLDEFATVAYKGVIPATALSRCRVPRWFEQGYRRKFQGAKASSHAAAAPG